LKKLHETASGKNDATMFFLLDELLRQRTQKLAIIEMEKAMIRHLGKEKLLRLLMTIPGIGVRTGILAIAEIWDMKRFKTKDDLCAYVGFAPQLVGSGENERTQGGGQRKHKQLQSKLVEGAWRAIGVDVELRAKYCQLAGKGSPQRAVFVVAKKILLRMRAVWLQEKEYSLNRVLK